MTIELQFYSLGFEHVVLEGASEDGVSTRHYASGKTV